VCCSSGSCDNGLLQTHQFSKAVCEGIMHKAGQIVRYSSASTTPASLEGDFLCLLKSHLSTRRIAWSNYDRRSPPAANVQRKRGQFDELCAAATRKCAGGGWPADTISSKPAQLASMNRNEI